MREHAQLACTGECTHEYIYTASVGSTYSWGLDHVGRGNINSSSGLLSSVAGPMTWALSSSEANSTVLHFVTTQKPSGCVLRSQHTTVTGLPLPYIFGSTSLLLPMPGSLEVAHGDKTYTV